MILPSSLNPPMTLPVPPVCPVSTRQHPHLASASRGQRQNYKTSAPAHSHRPWSMDIQLTVWTVLFTLEAFSPRIATLVQTINRRIALASSVMVSLQRIWKDRNLSTTTKVRVYWAVVTSVLLYDSETWTVLASDLRTLEAFHMKCQRQLLQVKWHQFVRNDQISTVTNLPSISSTISRRRNAVLGHIARLDEEVPLPAHKALRHHIDLTLGWLPSREWKRPPGRPRCRWIDQIRRDNDNTPPADLWRIAVRRGHRGATLRPSLASRWRRLVRRHLEFCTAPWSPHSSSLR